MPVAKADKLKEEAERILNDITAGQRYRIAAATMLDLIAGGSYSEARQVAKSLIEHPG